jgi:hypothetical protein
MKFKVRTEKGVWEVEADSAAAAQLKAEARGHTVVEVAAMTTTPLEPAYQDAPAIAALAEEVRETRAKIDALIEATSTPHWYDDRQTYFKVHRDAVVWGVVMLIGAFLLLWLLLYIFLGIRLI